MPADDMFMEGSDDDDDIFLSDALTAEQHSVRLFLCVTCHI